jgi:hypothetical protein
MRSTVVVACMLLGTRAPAGAQVSIGINLQAYPDLVAVPSYPQASKGDPEQRRDH